MTLIEPRVKHGDASDGSPSSGPLGRAIVRTDGPPKVRGAATYALEHRLEGLLHCVIVQSTVGAGRIVAIDRSAAEASPGVRLVLDAGNSLKLRSQAGLLWQQAARRRPTPHSRRISATTARWLRRSSQTPWSRHRRQRNSCVLTLSPGQSSQHTMTLGPVTATRFLWTRIGATRMARLPKRPW